MLHAPCFPFLGPWACQTCTAQNDEHILKCRSCQQAKTEQKAICGVCRQRYETEEGRGRDGTGRTHTRNDRSACLRFALGVWLMFLRVMCHAHACAHDAHAHAHAHAYAYVKCSCPSMPCPSAHALTVPLSCLLSPVPRLVFHSTPSFLRCVALAFLPPICSTLCLTPCVMSRNHHRRYTTICPVSAIRRDTEEWRRDKRWSRSHLLP